MTLIEPFETRARIDACPGQAKREAEERSVEARARTRCGDGWPKRDESEAGVEALADRGRLVLYPSAPLAVPVGDLVERARGSRPGGEGSAADPRKFKTAGGSRREAEPIAQSMKNPGGGPKRRDAAAQPGRLDIGKGHDRRDADPGFVRPGGGTRPRDAIPGIVRPFGGTRVPRGIRGSGANPRGVRPGNGNNQ